MIHSLRQSGPDRRPARVLMALCVLGLCASFLHAEGPYSPPPTDTRILQGVDFSHAQLIAPELTQLYQDCDRRTDRGGCATDPAHNTVILKFPEGPVFFDAKLAIDADGSVLSKKHEHPNQPETAFRYPGSLLSLDSEHVPYIVMPMGDFRRVSGIGLGDLAVVIKDSQVHFAIVGDIGPRTHIGEGSMNLHDRFGHLNCRSRDAAGNCSDFVDVSLDAPVLFFLFPDSRKLIADGLTPENINERIATVGEQLWSAFVNAQHDRGRE